MKIKIVSIIAFLFCALLTQAQIDRSKQPEPGPTPKINLGQPETFQLNNGLTVMIVENHKLPRVSVSLSIDNAPIYEGNKAGVSSLTGSVLGSGTKNMSKDAFNERIDYLGASINYGSNGASASCLSKYFEEILGLMADGALNPVFPQEEFEKQREQLLTGLKSQEKDVAAISNRVKNALAYGKEHPYGEFITEETVNNVTLNDIKNFYSQYFAPEKAYLVIVGDVDSKQTKKLVKKNFSIWNKAKAPQVSYSAPNNLQYTQINFVDMPNAVQSEIKVVNNIDLKMSDPDYFNTLMANHILGGSFGSYLNMNLREEHGFTYGARSSVNTDKYGAGLFQASAKVRNAVTDSSVVEFMKEINRIRTEDVKEETLQNAKAKYLGNFVMALENPSTVARYALNIKTQNLPEDFYETYLQKINAVTVADVKNAANKYFLYDNARIVIVGKGSDVIDGLENTKLNGKSTVIKYYDKFAKEVEKPEFKKTVPEGLTANNVVEKYLKAIGGVDKLKMVKSIYKTAEAEMQGMSINMEVKTTPNNQMAVDIKMMGNSLNKQVVNGDKGYTVVQGQRKEMSEEDLKSSKLTATTFPELKYINNSDISLNGIENVDGQDAYALKVSDKLTSFYSIESGLKVKDLISTKQNGQDFSSSIYYNNYKEVDGIKFPYTMSQTFGPQKMDFEVKEIKINEGVSDADFN
ncbi:M16 family metallopeptidase [Zhouia amylolytica]|uniref:Zinc protease-like protein y4wB n=1 Tax=Zhouia amylolytica AD3 TaxID=1286632 RepID=W2UKV2_9FLAO|nr:pitrilysin family protein [Zhouia amylolytica]ETN94624.1 zinc protease-like protein y4wB [Zhouia amylolytica AD3]